MITYNNRERFSFQYCHELLLLKSCFNIQILLLESQNPEFVSWAGCIYSVCTAPHIYARIRTNGHSGRLMLYLHRQCLYISHHVQLPLYCSIIGTITLKRSFSIITH